MRGYLLIFNTETNKDAVKLNHRLLGRIISVPGKEGTLRYYSGGALDDVPHKRLKEGCYFSTKDVELGDGLVKLKADVLLDDKELDTGREYWKTHAKKKNLIVKNL